jgi:hypothetical protein
MAALAQTRLMLLCCEPLRAAAVAELARADGRRTLTCAAPSSIAWGDDGTSSDPPLSALSRLNASVGWPD